MTLFSMFFGDLLLLKENHLFYENKYDFTPKVTFLIIFYWFQCFDYNQENKHYIRFLSLKLYKVSIFNLFGRLNTFCRKQLVVEIKNIFFGFLPPTNKNMKKPWKSHFLGRIFFFIQISYIILLKGGFV